ncbi:type II toxin-antitoxin system VapB family antitoxin [uncultured Mobiluncus sp.]|uniref:type II toxin-antitoxin system VapB family antitoxin n=1 Tax=uncultured Mobiluncus sp. TaxID=293425 RepID=UPI00261019C0|nr:type II toxin-antitoxin system VapB family antitoxin [uncultured Mobiluncus sp.]
MPMLTIKDPQVYENVRELANRKGMTMTAVVRELAQREIETTRRPTYEEKLQAIREIQAQVEEEGITFLTDDDLYDEDGLPK